MESLRRVQSESSMGRQRTLETHPECCTQKQSKQHPQVQPHHPTPTTPAKLDYCEKLFNQNKELQKIRQEQEKQIESLQETVSKLIHDNKLLMSNIGDRIEDSVLLRLKVASSNQELHNALENTRVMSHTVHELQDQISQLKQIHGSKITPRTIIISKLLKLLRETWWRTRETTICIPCPCGRCGRDIPLQSRGPLVKLLQLAEDKCLGERNIRTYDTVLELMKVLDGIDPQLTLNARNVAARMHRKLIANNFMQSPFDLRFRDLTHNEVGSPLKADSTLFSLYNIDHAGETLRIPFFKRFLRTEPTPIECVICTDSYHEVFYGSLEEWTKVCSEFEGDWMWKILLFPQKLYDEYLKLKALSQMPYFMWCLAEKCSSGQIHDLTFDSHVSCAECEFEMCFTHQVKWYEGLTCEQYDSLKRTGDPESEETQKWMATNTKPCPEYGIHVQKGNGCFHMTCSVYHHEFCWECLASWRNIRSGSGGYDRSAHNDGCFFKTSSQQPTEVIGSTIPVTG
ncbi:hypothetical protein HG530_013253 [Fusarium avenaceum]|nr:hypothetical protein HG530_013253 [Fusarium avenaceum]